MLLLNPAGKKNKKTPVSTYVWQEKLSIKADNSVLEKALNFPQGTLSVLQKALELRLPRTASWSLELIKHKEPFLTASSYYKRGVSVVGYPFARPIQKQSKIRFKSFKEVIDFLLETEAFIILDSNVEKKWPLLENVLNSSFFILKDPSEKTKNLETVSHLMEAYQKAKVKKKIIVIGGGVTLDTSAFAASLLNVPVTLLPTTLLAMVDASIGGKNGVNVWPYGKNLVGSFYFPEEMIICSDFIETLGPREIISGGAEALKHALLISDRALLKKLSCSLASDDRLALIEEIPRLVQVKQEVVSLDPFEKSYRMILNLGHTLGHALEALSAVRKGSKITHGEAVALGLLFVVLLSEFLGKISLDKSRVLVQQLLGSSCLLTRKSFFTYLGRDPLDKKTWLAIQGYLSQDKKQRISEDGFHEWVLLYSEGFVPGKKSYLTRVSSKISEKIWFKMWSDFLKG